MSGLAAIRALTRAGHDVTGYEVGSAVGGMWRYDNDSGRSAAYSSLEANTSKRRMQYPSFPQPESAPAFPHHSDMLAYLDAYAEANDLTRHVRFGAMVESAEPADGGWNVTVVGERPRHFDWLVVAAGHYWQPIVPELSGAFTGETMHVREYRTPQRFAGKRVIVVGGGQSALDIAAEISSVAASVRTRGRSDAPSAHRRCRQADRRAGLPGNDGQRCRPAQRPVEGNLLLALQDQGGTPARGPRRADRPARHGLDRAAEDCVGG